jgi:cellulose synthase/poly-beta-1,6-N-acetylglucosamine synthase-like glycosyltransferase
MYIEAATIFFTAAGLILIQTAYPFILALISLFVKNKRDPVTLPAGPMLDITLIIPVYKNDVRLLPEKLANCSTLNYPSEKLEILVSADGDLPELPGIMNDASCNFSLRYHQTGTWVGKNLALNQAVKKSTGTIIVVSDVDAALDPDAISMINRLMMEPNVGGCAGTVEINRSDDRNGGIGAVQKKYWLFEKRVKRAEMDLLGSVTSCSGQLYAVRKALRPDVPADVCDDIFTLLAVVKQGYAFGSLPKTSAYIPKPSKTISGEVNRRSRIVTRGVNAIWKNRQVFVQKNTFCYGIALFCHKVVRRLIPLLLIFLFITNFMLAFSGVYWAGFFFCQVLFYGAAILSYYRLLNVKGMAAFSYFIAFNIGTGIGFFHFLTGKGKSKW